VQIDKEYATRESSGSNETARDCFAQCSVAAAAAAATLHSVSVAVALRRGGGARETATKTRVDFSVAFAFAFSSQGYGERGTSRCCSASALLVRGLGARLRARFKQKIGAGGLYQARRGACSRLSLTHLAAHASSPRRSLSLGRFGCLNPSLLLRLLVEEQEQHSLPYSRLRRLWKSRKLLSSASQLPSSAARLVVSLLARSRTSRPRASIPLSVPRSPSLSLALPRSLASNSSRSWRQPLRICPLQLQRVSPLA